jgi:ubiquinone biosynthesis protein UbiJ
MSYPKVNRETITINGKHLTAYLVEFKNAIIGVFSEEEGNFGTLALALPAYQHQPEVGRSTILLGHKNAALARILAENLAAKFGKISLSSVFLRLEGDLETGKALTNLIQKTEEKDFKTLKSLLKT